MTVRSGIRTSVDTGRAAAGMQRPGVDPRVWVCLAKVTELGVDLANGVYADVQLMPTGEKETCLVGTGYAGAGYGAWLPLKVDDIVVVLVPRGDWGMGPVIVSRVWTGSEPPPAELLVTPGSDDPPTSPVVVVGPGQTVRVVCRPGGTVEVVGDVPDPLKPPNAVSLSTPTDANFERFKAAIQGWTPVPLDGGAALKLALELMFIGASPPAAAPPVPPIPGGTSTPNPPWPEATGARVLKGD